MTFPWLDQPLTTQTWLWRLERRDGVAIGFTSHDRDIVISGFRYRANPGMTPSAIALTDGISGDDMDVAASLTSSAIAEQDLDAGRWNGARLQVMMADWTDPDADLVPVLTGHFGQIQRKGQSFTAEFLGLKQRLSRAETCVTSPTCRAQLGDHRCGISLHTRRQEVTVSMADRHQLTWENAAQEITLYHHGLVRFLDGPNCGLEFMALGSHDGMLALSEAPPFAIAVGDRVQLTQGCDKRIETCTAKFANTRNFRGEPYLPGNDLLTRYPSAG